MSPRRRRWAAIGALVCAAAAITAQRARAEEASTAAPDATVRTDEAPDGPRGGRTAGSAASGADLAGPLRLTRPLAPETLARVLAEAESLYRARQFEQARQAYATLVELEPLNAHAWLRLGNLHQHAGRDDDALEAYRHASLTVPSSIPEAEARGKALLNIALLHVASASRAIDELDAMRLASLGEARGDVARQVGAQRHRAARAATRDFDVPRPAGRGGAPRARADAAGSGPVPAAPPTPEPEPVSAGSGPAAADATGPYTVDRWTARPRRAPTRRESPGRGAIVEPLVGAPAAMPPSPSPAVEVLRGGLPATRP